MTLDDLTRGVKDDISYISSSQTNIDLINSYCTASDSLFKNPTRSSCSLVNPIKDSDHFSDICCDGSENPEDCTLDAVQCLFDVSDYHNRAKTMKNMELPQVKSNKQTVTDFCKAGNLVLSKGCNTNGDTYPMNNQRFLEYCCDHGTDMEQCNDNSLNCTLYSSDFQALSTSTFTDDYMASWNDSKDEIKDFCTLGNKTINCNSYPSMNSSIFRKMCCNNSTNGGDCNDESLDCTFKSSTFKQYDTRLQNANIGRDMEELVSSYCDAGNQLIHSSCTQVNPMNSSTFRKLCCNNSTDSKDCDSSSFSCLFDTVDFASSSSSIGNMNITSAYANQSSISDYCVLGKKVISEGCTQTIPTNNSVFRDLCCNNNTDPNYCNTNSMQCMFDSSKFLQRDQNMGGTTISSIENNLNSVSAYCDLGNSISSRGCTQTIPTNSAKYRELCCGGSSNQTDCNSTVFNCAIDSGSFVNTNNTFSSYDLVNVSSSNLTGFCELGVKVLNNGCTQTQPLNSSTFQTFCCNNTNNSNNCNNHAIQCTIDSGDFVKKSQSLSTMTQSDAASSIAVVKAYCELGEKIKSSCSIIEPITYDAYRNLCCVGNTSYENCTSDTSCISTSSSFQTKNNTMNLTPISNVEETSTRNYCELGNTLIQNNCNQTKAINYPKFQEFCCNNTNDSSKCTNDSIQCTLDAASFLSLDNSYKNIQLSSVNTNQSQISAYCRSGDSLIQRGCNTTKPNTSAKFNEFCCDGSTNPSDCTENALQHTLKASNFLYLDGGYNSVTDASLVSDWCDTGFELLPYLPSVVQTNNFKRICCNGGSCTSPIDCGVSAWGSYGTCTDTSGSQALCEQTGTQTRTRTVTRPARNGGVVCPSLTDVIACSGTCDCIGTWSNWSTCPTDDCYGDVKLSNRVFNVTQQPGNGGAACPSPLNQDHYCGNTCAYRIYPNTKMYTPSMYIGTSYVQTHEQCADACKNKPGCVSSMMNSFNGNAWRCDMYNYLQYYYPSTNTHLSYQYKSFLNSSNKVTASRDSFVGKWKDTQNNITFTLTADSSDPTLLRAKGSNNHTIVLSLDLVNGCFYWLDSGGALAGTTDNNTIVFSNGGVWIRN